MNKLSAILNPALAAAVASAGHFDELVIADCGLPLPPGPKVIDLSVVRGVPSFEVVLGLLMKEMKVDRIIIAEEIVKQNAPVYDLIQAMTKSDDPKNAVEVEKVSHDNFKTRCQRAKWIVRTGENTPYANAILVAGVSF